MDRYRIIREYVGLVWRAEGSDCIFENERAEKRKGEVKWAMDLQTHA